MPQQLDVPTLDRRHGRSSLADTSLETAVSRFCWPDYDTIRDNSSMETGDIRRKFVTSTVSLKAPIVCSRYSPSISPLRPSVVAHPCSWNLLRAKSG